MSLRETNRMELEDKCWQVLDDETMEELLKTVEAQDKMKPLDASVPDWSGVKEISDEDRYEDDVEMWLDYFRDVSFEMRKGKDPEDRLREWFEIMRSQLADHPHSPVTPERACEAIQRCWEEMLRDDYYRISREDWWVKLEVPEGADWEACVCDFLPVRAVVDESYTLERDRINALRQRVKVTNSAVDRAALVAENTSLVHTLQQQYEAMEPGLIAHYVIENKWVPLLYRRLMELLPKKEDGSFLGREE